MEYVSTACPFCGGTLINKNNGEYVCAYCLQPLDRSNGKLSDGYNKLASYNFVGAASFFRGMIGVGGAEAYYGLFLAENRIEENKQKNAIYPVVFSYRPQPFATDSNYTLLRSLCENDRMLSQKLERIEAARAATLTPQTEYDVLLFTDDPHNKECAEFARVLSARGYRILISSDFASADIATLRCASAAYVFASTLTAVEKTVSAGIARKFLLLENERTSTTGLGKKPMKLVTSLALPNLLANGISDILDVCTDLNFGAEVRRLGGAARAKERNFVLRVRESVSCDTPVLARKKRIVSPVAEIDDEEADIGRMERNLQAGAFSDVRKLYEKLKKKGCGNVRMYWLAYLAAAKTRNEREFVTAADESAFSPQALALCDAALYGCTNGEQAKPYVQTLTDAALRLIDRKKTGLASRALQAAFEYDYADSYAPALLDRLNAAKEGLLPDDYFFLQKTVLERVQSGDTGFILRHTLGAVDYALSRKLYRHADDLIESALDYFPHESELYARKLFCVNKVCGFDRLLACDYPRLGDYFACYVAANPPEKADGILRNTFDALVKNASARGYEKFSAAIDDVLDLGNMPELGSGNIFGASDYCNVGESALLCGDFASAGAYFAQAIEKDGRSYLAYWGALKAALCCKSDRMLEECDTPIDEAGNYYANAYKSAAHGIDDDFIRRIEEVLARRRTVIKKDGHVFRKDDFTVSNGKLIRYTGKDTENVLVGGGIYRIGADAFRGSSVKSVIVEKGVTAIGDGAFAFSDIENIVLPASVSEMGRGVFCGCENLCTIKAQAPVSVFGGGVYFGSRLVSYLPALHRKAACGNVTEIRAGTDTVGENAFFDACGSSEVRLPASVRTVEPNAFRGCEGLRISGNVPAIKQTLTGETPFGDCVLTSGRLTPSDERIWASLYGDCRNNMHVPAFGGTAGQIRKLFDTQGKVGGGLLVKNDRVFFAANGALFVASLRGVFSGEQSVPERIHLPYAPTGTGVLWNGYIVQPVDYERCTLAYIDAAGKISTSVRIGAPLTRPLCLMNDVLLCVSDDTLFAVDLARASVRERTMPEKITCVPCGTGNLFVVAGERNVYALTPSLEGNAVCSLNGVNYAQGAGKILRGRLTAYGADVWWIERTDSEIYLARTDGNRTERIVLPRRIVDFMQTQPVFAGGNFYGGATKSILTAPVVPYEAEWNFRVAAPVSGKYAELAIVGDKPFVNGMSGAYANLRLRAFYKDAALLCDIEKGGVYVAGI